MKKLIIIGLAMLLAVPSIDARRKSAKAGEFENGVYTDSQYNLELTIPDAWKVKVGKEKENVRLLLTKRNYDIPNDYLNVPDYTQIPMIAVYVDTTSLGEHAFLDSLLSHDFNSDQKKDILREFTILNENDLVPKKRSRLEVGGEVGLLWSAEAKYMKEIQTSMGSASGTRVRRSYGGAIAAVKKDNTIVLFHIMTEYEFFEPVMAEVMQVIQSLKFVGEDEG